MSQKIVKVSASEPIPAEVLQSGGTPPEAPSRFSRVLHFVMIFSITFLALQLFMGEKPEEVALNAQDVVVMAPEAFTLGQPVEVTVRNNTPAAIVLGVCPELPLPVMEYVNGVWEKQTARADGARCAAVPTEIAPQSETTVSFAPWQKTLFNEVGTYRVLVPVEGKEFYAEFEKRESGFFGRIWNEGLYNPLYNLLVFLIREFEGSFGWALVVFVVCVRLLLLYPYHRSMVAQKHMQRVQPELEKIKKKHAGDQQAIARETMAVFKREKVSPFGSILPVLLQIPFFLAVFWIVQGGLLENNFARLYPWLADFSFTEVSTLFYGVDLTRPEFVVLPLLVGGLQFVQLRLAMAASKKAPQSDHPLADMLKNMQNVMQYAMPAMMVVFTALWPAAVGVYWAVSTAFGVVQQYVVNRFIR